MAGAFPNKWPFPIARISSPFLRSRALKALEWPTCLRIHHELHQFASQPTIPTTTHSSIHSTANRFISISNFLPCLDAFAGVLQPPFSRGCLKLLRPSQLLRCWMIAFQEFRAMYPRTLLDVRHRDGEVAPGPDITPRIERSSQGIR